MLATLRWRHASRVLAAAEQKLSARVAELQALQKKLEALDAGAEGTRGRRAGRAW